MNFFRGVTSLPIAAAITLGLFIAMAALIKQDAKTAPAKETPSISILAKIIETPAHTPKPEQTKLNEAPPPPETKWPKEIGPVDPIEFPGPEKIDVTKQPHGPGGAATPIIRIAPQYPEACRSRGAEGRVLVQFDVTERGEVTNVRIISSDNRCFDRAVIRTVMDWKYPPEARRGITESFVFTLTE